MPCTQVLRTRIFSWNLAASRGEVSDNDIHALKSICGRLADKEAHSIVLRAVTVPSTINAMKMGRGGGGGDDFSLSFRPLQLTLLVLVHRPHDFCENHRGQSTLRMHNRM